MVTGGARAARGGISPSFPGIADWLHAPAAFDPVAPGRPATLVNFWTYSCINARRTLPYLRRWEATYGPAELQILGIPTPESGVEHLRGHVEQAVRELAHPLSLGQNNSYRSWRDWNNRAWPPSTCWTRREGAYCSPRAKVTRA
ncbi:hypothetical protein [Falsiroseomonas sp. E2-1-a4]|uniref:hypothetical protein n=1 Tax=Falsiroseomonas sp. E2-1-a4 TaxID=3239299 RepID=UPI003F30E95E